MAVAFLSDTGIAVVAVLVVVIFGGSQLPKLARNLGLAGKEFRKAHDQAEKDGTEAPAASAAAPPPVVPPPAVVPPAPAPPAVGSGGQDDRVTLSKAELQALLDEREARARGQASS